MLILSLCVSAVPVMGAPSLANAGRKLSIDLTVGIECLITRIITAPVMFILRLIWLDDQCGNTRTYLNRSCVGGCMISSYESADQSLARFSAACFVSSTA